MEKEIKKHLLASAIVAVGGVGAFIAFSLNPKELVGGIALETQIPKIATTEANLLTVDFELSARAALIKDLRSGELLYVKDPNQKLPVASLTKLMTALVVVKNMPLDKVVGITFEDTETVPNTVKLVQGEKLKTLDLLQAMLIASANDAALALSRAVYNDPEKFVQEMNREAQRLGMSNTFFTNPVGFDDPFQYSTATDLAKLVEEFLSYGELQKIVGTRETVIVSLDGSLRHKLVTTNRLMLENPEIRGIKTGYTSEAKGNLIILDNHFYSIILGSDDREVETLKVLQWSSRLQI